MSNLFLNYVSSFKFSIYIFKKVICSLVKLSLIMLLNSLAS